MCEHFAEIAEFLGDKQHGEQKIKKSRNDFLRSFWWIPGSWTTTRLPPEVTSGLSLRLRCHIKHTHDGAGVPIVLEIQGRLAWPQRSIHDKTDPQSIARRSQKKTSGGHDFYKFRPSAGSKQHARPKRSNIPFYRFVPKEQTLGSLLLLPHRLHHILKNSERADFL